MKVTLKSIIQKRRPDVFIVNEGNAITFDEFYNDVAKLNIPVSSDIVALRCSSNYKSIVALFALWAQNNTVCLLPKNETESETQRHKDNIPFKKIYSPSSFEKGDLKNVDINFLDKDTRLLVLSSGTSGQSKAMAHGMSQLYWSALGSINFYNFSKSDRYPLTLPFHHIGGLMIAIRCLFSGAILEIHPKRSVAIHSQTATILSLVPAQLYDKILNKDRPCSLKAILLGGARCSEKILNMAHSLNYPISLTYGSSETCSQVYASKVNEKAKGPTQLLDFRAATIKNGLLCVKGATLMNYYYTKMEKVFPFDDQGFYHTNDLAFWKDHLEIKRKDSMMISGGENIPTSSWEQRLLLHEDIIDTKAIVCNDDRMGQVGYLFYHSRTPIDEKELKNYLSTFLSSYKLPKRIIPFPKLENKIKHTQMQLETYAQQLK